MESFIKHSFLLLIALLLINIINAKNTNTLSNDDKEIEEVKDKYYLITLNNTYGDFKIYTKPEKSKRHLSKVEKFVFSFIDDVHELIVENKASYEDQEKLEEIENSGKLRKRRNNEEIYTNYGDSEFINPIACGNNTVIFNAYLSETLAKEVEKFDDVISISPVTKVHADHNNYSVDDILNEAKWEKLAVRPDADLHLSLISQGKIKRNLANEYDTNYYFPRSAGKGVNIIVIDSSFSFDYFEFSNNKDRRVECMARFIREQVSDIAAGLMHGTAPRANILGVSLLVDKVGSYDTNDVVAALGYVAEHLVEAHNTIINMSFSGDADIENQRDYMYGSKDVINKITEKGGIVVASAGNAKTELIPRNNTNAYIPCQFKNVICVGGIENSNTTAIPDVYKRAENSNYGSGVDIYAPFHVDTEYIGLESFVVPDQIRGTSFSAPMTAGIIASVISENRDIKFTRDSMLEYLLKRAIPFDIEGKTQYTLNNGKHIVYSQDNKYNGCGILSGNRPCEKLCNRNSNNCKLQKMKDQCDIMDGLFIHDSQNYACLIKYDNDYNLFNSKNSVCFTDGASKYCVNHSISIYDECNKSSGNFNGKKCISNIYNLSLQNGIHWQSGLKYLNKVFNYSTSVRDEDRQECEKYKGVFLENEYGEYICVTHYFGKLYNSSGYCVYAIPSIKEYSEKIMYCVDLHHSNMDICNKYLKQGDFAKCYDEIHELSSKSLYYMEPARNEYTEF
ncbi:hypothetical protein PIROE2DRAFT_6783 [Piromyces sp. E2]|nr:hypothetical protein PIROE2DRAFT_6783 [Piromyces sp. E2]|eukprot:OUM66073.1 hypothetical protein PIROE2DRAFT_6783 [Piromyces sp. E2]